MTIAQKLADLSVKDFAKFSKEFNAAKKWSEGRWFGGVNYVFDDESVMVFRAGRIESPRPSFDIAELEEHYKRNPKTNVTQTKTVSLMPVKSPKSLKRTDGRLRANRPVKETKFFKFEVQERRRESDPWKHTARFPDDKTAKTYAKHLHGIRPDMFFRVIEL